MNTIRYRAIKKEKIFLEKVLTNHFEFGIIMYLKRLRIFWFSRTIFLEESLKRLRSEGSLLLTLPPSLSLK